MMDPEDLVDLDNFDEQYYRVKEAQGAGVAVFSVLAPGAGALNRAMRKARTQAVVVPPVISAGKAAGKALPATPVGSAARSAGKAAGKKPRAPPVDSGNPIKAVDEAIKNVETPVFFPARIAKTYNELIKLLSHGGVAAYLVDKFADMGCADTCPFLGNGEYRLPKKPALVADKEPVKEPAASTKQKPPVAAEKNPAVAAEKEPAASTKQKPPVAAQKNPAVAAEKEPAVATKQNPVVEPAVATKQNPTVAAEKNPVVVAEKEPHHSPCFYDEMQQKSNDLLYKGYNTGLKMTLDCNTDVMLADGSKLPKLEVDASTDSKDIKLWIDHSMNPGMKGVLSLQHVSKVDLRYRKALVAVTGRAELKDWPIVSLSSVLGTKSIAWGADMTLDTRSFLLSRYSCGVFLSKGDLCASLVMENDDVLVASCHHKIDETTSVAADIEHIVSSNKNTLTLGCSHIIDPATMFKGRLSTDGKVCVALKRNLKPKCYVSVSAECDCRLGGCTSGTKFGLAIALGA